LEVSVDNAIVVTTAGRESGYDCAREPSTRLVSVQESDSIIVSRLRLNYCIGAIVAVIYEQHLPGVRSHGSPNGSNQRSDVVALVVRRNDDSNVRNRRDIGFPRHSAGD
jgi:hypothetical protein